MQLTETGEIQETCEGVHQSVSDGAKCDIGDQRSNTTSSNNVTGSSTGSSSEDTDQNDSQDTNPEGNSAIPARLLTKVEEQRLKHEEQKITIELERKELERERLRLQRRKLSIEQDRRAGKYVRTEEDLLAINEKQCAAKIESLNLKEQNLAKIEQEDQDTESRLIKVEPSERQSVEKFPLEHTWRSIFLVGYLSVEENLPEGADEKDGEEVFGCTSIGSMSASMLYVILTLVLGFLRMPAVVGVLIAFSLLCISTTCMHIISTLSDGRRVIFVQGVYGTVCRPFFVILMFVAIFAAIRMVANSSA